MVMFIHAGRTTVPIITGGTHARRDCREIDGKTFCEVPKPAPTAADHHPDYIGFVMIAYVFLTLITIALVACHERISRWFRGQPFSSKESGK